MATKSIKQTPKAFVKATSPRDAMLADLKRSGLTAADAKKLGLQPFTEAASSVLGLSRAGAGYKVPYYDAEGNELEMFRYRYFATEVTSGFTKSVELRKYDQPRGTAPEIYLPQFVDWEDIAENASRPIIIVEGEKKSACVTKHCGVPALGLGGVWSFGSKGRYQTLLPALASWKWASREVCIVFDSDAAINPDILRAENRLARALTDRSARVRIARIPPDGDAKVGADDYIQKHEVEKFRELLEGAQEYGPAEALHTLNEEVLFVEHPCLVLRYPKENHPTDQPLYRMLKLNEFTQGVYADKHHSDVSSQKPKQVSTAQAWLKWPGRAKVDSMTYAPGEGRFFRGQFNLWEGWGVDPKEGGVEPFLEFYNHLTEGLSEEHRHWLMQWFAYPLQHPGAKLHTAVVIWTPRQGVGKSLLGNTFKRIYGSNFSKVTKPQLEGQFNAWQQYKCFIMGEEITGSDARDANKFADTLKDYITAEDVQVNGKFRDLANIPNTIQYYFTSNHQDAFQIERDDRRYFVHEVTSTKWTDQQFTAYVDWLDKGGAAALFHYMLNVSLEGFNPKAAAPQTAARAAMGDAGAHPADRLVREFLRDPALFGNAYKDRDLWTGQDIADVYHAQHHLDPEARYINKKMIGRALKNEGLQTIISANVPLVSGEGKAKYPTPYVLFNREDYRGKTDKELVAAYGHERKSNFKKSKKKVATMPHIRAPAAQGRVRITPEDHPELSPNHPRIASKSKLIRYGYK